MKIDNLEFNFYYVSPEVYAKQTGLSYAAALHFCKTKQLEAYQTDGGQWKIKVYKGDTVSKKEYDKILLENSRLQSIVEAVSKIIARNRRP